MLRAFLSLACLLSVATALRVPFGPHVSLNAMRAKTTLRFSNRYAKRYAKESKTEPLVDCLAAAENSAETLDCLLPYNESPAPPKSMTPAVDGFVYDAKVAPKKISANERRALLMGTGATRADCLASAENALEIEECYADYPASRVSDQELVLDGLDQMIADAQQEREAKKTDAENSDPLDPLPFGLLAAAFVVAAASNMSF